MRTGGTPKTSETSICAMVKALVYWGIISPSLGLLCKGYVNTNWFVVKQPLWKIWKSVGIMTFPIYGKTIQMFQTTNQQINLDAPKFLVENQKKQVPSSSRPLLPIQETDSPARPLSAPPPAENAIRIIRRVKCYISWWRFAGGFNTTPWNLEKSQE